ncbi:MAG: hypothetical protein HY815_25915 [Candidatus Riflebacteria bacterium]|nr:hypothetical protein [Candidatus Riflebacteria bacterium]
MRSRVAWFVATALVCVATIGYLSAVRPRGKVGDARSDGVHYYRLAAQFHAGTTPTERVSLCYRIGIPFAVAWLAKALRIPIESAWALMNYLACAIFLSAFFVFALRFVEPPLAFLGTILFLLPYHVFVFLLCDHPFHVDLWFFALEAIGLLLISARRARTRRVLVALGALALLGGLIRESTLMIPACLLLAS